MPENAMGCFFLALVSKCRKTLVECLLTSALVCFPVSLSSRGQYWISHIFELHSRSRMRVCLLCILCFQRCRWFRWTNGWNQKQERILICGHGNFLVESIVLRYIPHWKDLSQMWLSQIRREILRCWQLDDLEMLEVLVASTTWWNCWPSYEEGSFHACCN